MVNPGIVYMLASVVLFAVAVVVHFHTSHLSLPISPVVTALAVILPIAAFLNAYIYPNLLRTSHACAAATPPRNLPARLAPVVLQGLQAVLTVVLAALLLRGVVPSPTLDFLLEHEWDELFAARDGESIRLVQNTYRCCGLDSLDDRAYPFDGAESCAKTYNRTETCMAPWRSAMQATSALDFGVALAVGLMQVGWLWSPFLSPRERPLTAPPDSGSADDERTNGLVDRPTKSGLEAWRARQRQQPGPALTRRRRGDGFSPGRGVKRIRRRARKRDGANGQC